MSGAAAYVALMSNRADNKKEQQQQLSYSNSPKCQQTMSPIRNCPPTRDRVAEWRDIAKEVIEEADHGSI